MVSLLKRLFTRAEKAAHVEGDWYARGILFALNRRRKQKEDRWQPDLETVQGRIISLMRPGEKRKEFADRVGIARESLTRYLRQGAPLGIASARKIAEVCGVSEVWLLYGVEPGDQPPPRTQTVVRRLGMKSSKRLTDSDRDGLIAELIKEYSIKKEDRETLAELIRESLNDETIREEVILLWNLIKARR